MYLRHKKKTGRSNPGPIEYLLMVVLVVVLVIGLMSLFEPQLIKLVSFIREYLMNSL